MWCESAILACSPGSGPQTNKTPGLHVFCAANITKGEMKNYQFRGASQYLPSHFFRYLQIV
jgi:hypothetical protein